MISEAINFNEPFNYDFTVTNIKEETCTNALSE